jgi:hypothetical protein
MFAESNNKPSLYTDRVSYRKMGRQVFQLLKKGSTSSQSMAAKRDTGNVHPPTPRLIKHKDQQIQREKLNVDCHAQSFVNIKAFGLEYVVVLAFNLPKSPLSTHRPLSDHHPSQPCAGTIPVSA